MATSTAAARRFDGLDAAAVECESRCESYGGLVGRMIGEVDARMTAVAVVAERGESPEDFFHVISVACGYVGLLAGFAVAGIGLSALL